MHAIIAAQFVIVIGAVMQINRPRSTPGDFGGWGRIGAVLFG